ncbi:MAG: hypothetical protein ACC655_05515 [Rhodothermia bacterium]
MGRIGILIYGIFAYITFVVAILYLVGFLGNIVVPRSIDAGTEAPVVIAAVVDILLIVVFAVQYSVMARPGFKKWWTRKIPEPIERSTYVLFTSSAFGLMFWFWRPIPDTVWHFDLFGLRQVKLAATGNPYEPSGFTQIGLYRIIRKSDHSELSNN